MVYLGNLAFRHGDSARSTALIVQALPLCRECGEQSDTTRALGNVAQLLLARGDVDGVRALCEESLTLCLRVGDNFCIAVALSGLAAVSAVGGRAERAAHLLGASGAFLSAVGARAVPHLGQLALARRLAEATLPLPVLASAWAASQVLSSEGARVRGQGGFSHRPTPNGQRAQRQAHHPPREDDSPQPCRRQADQL